MNRKRDEAHCTLTADNALMKHLSNSLAMLRSSRPSQRARWIVSLSLLPMLVLMVSCSGTSPDVIDPALSKRTEVALFAVNAAGSGDILRFSESQQAVVTQHDYEDVNGTPLGKSVDAIYEAYDSLFLLNRSAGTITVLDLQTRKKLAELGGFGSSAGGGLCGLTFSNRSQAWAVSYGTRALFLIAPYNLSVLPEIALPGNPTAVGASGTRVFVGMQMDDGSGGLAVLSSNAGGTYTVEQVIPFATPPILVTGTAGGSQAFIMTAGSPGADSANPADDVHPSIAIVGTAAPVQVFFQFDLPFSPSLFRRIGKPPVWASPVYQDYIFIALPVGVLKVDMISGSMEEVGLPEDYLAVGTDYFSLLTYALLPDGRTVRRVDRDFNYLPDLVLPVNAGAIRFVSSSRIR